MEAEVVDSLWELGRQQGSFYHNKITVTRSVWQEGQYGVYNLFFNSIDEVVAYFIVEEVGDGLYDPEDRVIVFSYNQPTGPIDRIYAFFENKPFVAVVKALGDQLISVNLDLDISRKVIDDLDPGFYPPSSITDRGEIDEQVLDDIILQDFTDANLHNFNRLISTDLNKEAFGTSSPAIVTPDSLKPSNFNRLRSANPSVQKANGKNTCPCKNNTSALTRSNGYSSQDLNISPLQTIRTENSEILFNEYDHLTESLSGLCEPSLTQPCRNEIEPGGIAPRPDLSLGVAELRDDPDHPSLVGRQLSTNKRFLPERNLLNTPSFRSWQV